MTVQIYEGDSLAVLRTLESESVQLVCTSPPYFGLRAYGTNPQVWGGDPAHSPHAWGEPGRIVGGSQKQGASSQRAGRANVEAQISTGTSTGSFCPCGAWRGELGSEPTPALFIEHLLTIFDEVKRVLRKDGLAFVNLSSSYAGSGKGPTGKTGIGDQAKRQGFVGDAATSDQSRSLSLGHVPACGSGGRGRSDSRRLGSSCSDLCDGCLADFLSHRDRSAGTDQPQQSDASLPSLIVRDSEHQDSLLETPGASVRAALASTTLESWLLSRGECSRCASRAASFARVGLLPYERAVQGSAHMTGDPFGSRLSSGAIQDQPSSTACRDETGDASADRTGDTDADSFSYQDYTKLDRHWKPKDLILIPEMFALGMQARGWYVRQQIVWAKKAPMPESVRDRFTRSWEPIWMFSKSPRYFFDQDANRVPAAMAPQRRLTAHPIGRGPAQQNGCNPLRDEPMQDAPAAGANMRDVWLLGPEPSSLDHYAGFPTEIPRRCILAGTSEKGACPECGAGWVRVVERGANPYPGSSRDHTADLIGTGAQRHASGMPSGTVMSKRWAERQAPQTTGWQPSCPCDAGPPRPCVVLDIFGGSGTTGLVADRLGRDAILIELNPDYCRMARKRLDSDAPLWSEPVEVVPAEQQAGLWESAG